MKATGVYNISIYFTGSIFGNVVKLNELFERLEKEGFSTYIIDGKSASLTYNPKKSASENKGNETESEKLEGLVIKLSLEETVDEKNNTYMRIKLSYENPPDEYPPDPFNSEDISKWEKRKENRNKIIRKVSLLVLNSIEDYIKT